MSSMYQRGIRERVPHGGNMDEYRDLMHGLCLFQLILLKKAHPVRLKSKEHFYRNKTTVMILNLLVKRLFFCLVVPVNPPQNGCVRTEASVRSTVEPFKGLFHPCLEHTTDYCLTTRRVKGPVHPTLGICPGASSHAHSSASSL